MEDRQDYHRTVSKFNTTIIARARQILPHAQRQKIKMQICDYSRVNLLKEYLRAKDQKKAVFIWIPKTAGTSLYNCLGATKLKSIYKVKHRFANKGIVTFGHMDYPELVKRRYISTQFDESAYKFTFVRNPYDRAVSLYFYSKKMKKLPANMSFLSFCRTLRENGCEPIGLYNTSGLSQCNPQIRWIENIEVDFVGKFESIEKDSQTLFRELGLQDLFLPKLNNIDRANYKKYYCSESKEIVERFYERDFRSFDYQYETSF